MRPLLPIWPLLPFLLVLTLILLLPSSLSEISNDKCGPEVDTIRSLNYGLWLRRSPCDYCKWDGVKCDSTQKVVNLTLSNHQLTGTISPALSNLTSLTTLDLSHNNFNGSIPPELGRLQHLKILNLGWNALGGKIPQNLTACRDLEEIHLEHNSLDGDIPTGFSACPKLKVFTVGNNRLYGLNSSDLVLLHDLEFLDLSFNRFNGSFPEALYNSQSLQSLSVAGNDLKGSLNKTFGQSLLNLVRLYMNDNSFEGGIPSHIVNATKLELLDLGNNKFNGSVPPNLCDLKNLTTLNLGGNWLGDGRANNLQIFNTTLPNCTNLQVLNLSGNGFRGNLSASIGRLSRKLQELDISHNNFSGPIPGEVFNLSSLSAFLNLSHNEFDGSLPEVGALDNLSVLDVSYNNLSGGIPSSLRNCKKLQFLYLQHNNFSGNISTNFTGLEKVLRQLDLSHNWFSGSIPQSFAAFGQLQLLNLSYNDFDGRLPTGGIFDDPNFFSVVGNKKLCGNETLKLVPCPAEITTGKSGAGLSKAVLIVIIVIGIFFFLLLLFWLFYKYRCSANKNSGGRFRQIFFPKAPLQVTYADLHTATKGFLSTNSIGSGGIGCVYREFVEDERRAVAVKVLNKGILVNSKRFVEECHDMRKITHQNLLEILTSCADVDINGDQFKALVFELMPNGNLGMWLHQEVISPEISFKKWNLSLFQRLNIAIDVASALVHLHCKLNKPIVHCNLKPSNILIGEYMTAHVTDFGMNRFFAMDAVIGKFTGYIAPECITGNPISPLWDVYSFGVLVLEMFTGKRPMDEAFGDSLSLHKYVLQMCSPHIDDVIDPLLISEETGGKLTDRTRGCLTSIIHTALICSKELPEDRMEMKEALEKLERAKLAFLEVGHPGGMPQNALGHAESASAMLV